MPSNAIGALSPYATTAQSVREFSSSATLKKADAPEQFEAFVLQTFIQEMLPKSADSVFGKGLAGDLWKSMLAEHIAAQLAEQGGIGIADTIRGQNHPGLTGKLSSIPPPAAVFFEDVNAADSLGSAPPVSIADIFGD